MRSRDDIRSALVGPVPSIRTPFTRHGEVDYDALRRMIDFDIDAGCPAVVLTAGDSQYWALSDDEIAAVTKAVVEHVAGRVMVVAADRGYATPQAVAFARYARDVGADLLMTLPPDWVGSTTPESMSEHYDAVSQVMPVMLVTNIFIARGEAFGLKAIELTLERSENVVAVKDDFGGQFARKMCLLVSGRWAVYSGGQKQNHLNLHPYGCGSYLSTFVTFRPDVARRYWKAIASGDVDGATEVIRTIDMPFFNYIRQSRGSFDACAHGILEIYGLAGRWRRRPYYTLSDEEMERLADMLRGLGVL